MATIETLTRRFARVFEPQQAEMLAETITEAYTELVKTSDFNELKEIVRDLADSQRDLADAQERTEVRMETLAGRMDDLTAAQQRTEVRMEELTAAQQQTGTKIDTLATRMEELAAAQQRTEVRMEELSAAQQRTETSLNNLIGVVSNLVAVVGDMRQDITTVRQEIGGLGHSLGYSLENEAYRSLPALLEKRYGIVLSERIVRAQVTGEEVNFLAHGQRNGTAVCLVGEAKTRLDERRVAQFELALAQLKVKVAAVRLQNADCELVPVLVTHFARPEAVQEAEREGIIVVQSFEW